MALSIFEGTYLLTEEKTDGEKQERRARQSSEAKIFHPGLSSMRKERITVDADEQLNLRETMASGAVVLARPPRAGLQLASNRQRLWRSERYKYHFKRTAESVHLQHSACAAPG